MKSFFGKDFALPMLVLLGLAAGTPQNVDAQIPVTDAGNWLVNVKNWVQGFTNGMTLVQQLQQGLKLYNNAVQLYGVASMEASFIKNKQILLAVGFLAQHAMIPGQPGWDKALTAAAGIANAGRVWQQMTAPGGTNSFQALNARIQMADSFGTSALNAIGSCNAAAARSDGSILR